MTESLTVNDLPQSERPRERLIGLGAEALSEQELIACVLGRGVAGESVLVSARRLLAAFGSLRGIAERSIEELVCIRGIGAAKAVQLKASAEIARRMAVSPSERLPIIDSVESAAAFLRPHLAMRTKEHFVALLLSGRHRLIRMSTIAVGSLTATLVHPRELFTEAIAAHAAAVLVAHNHPSGDPEPSAEDLRITGRLAEAGALLGIEFLDHLIVASGGVVSLRAAGAIEAQDDVWGAGRQRPRRRGRRPRG